jgi:hypothetical protein
VIGPELLTVGARVLAYDVITGVEIRALLRALEIAPGDRRRADLGPPQKSLQINRAGRTVQITTAMLISGSCGIGRPLGDDKKLRGYLIAGQENLPT